MPMVLEQLPQAGGKRCLGRAEGNVSSAGNSWKPTKQFSKVKAEKSSEAERVWGSPNRYLIESLLPKIPWSLHGKFLEGRNSWLLFPISWKLKAKAIDLSSPRCKHTWSESGWLWEAGRTQQKVLTRIQFPVVVNNLIAFPCGGLSRVKDSPDLESPGSTAQTNRSALKIQLRKQVSTVTFSSGCSSWVLVCVLYFPGLLVLIILSLEFQHSFGSMSPDPISVSSLFLKIARGWWNNQ